MPSWPDEAGVGGPPQLALSTETGAAGAWPDGQGLPPIGPAEQRPTWSWRIGFPAVAALLLAVAYLLLGWSREGQSFFVVSSFFAERGARDFGDFYLLCIAGPTALTAVLAGFAAATDLKPVKLAQLAVGLLALGAAVLLGLGERGFLAMLLVWGLAQLLWVVAIGFTRRIALRVTAAAYLGGCALLHIGTLVTWDAPWLSGTAYLPVLGYLVGAVGAAIGPRYQQVYGQL